MIINAEKLRDRLEAAEARTEQALEATSPDDQLASAVRELLAVEREIKVLLSEVIEDSETEANEDESVPAHAEDEAVQVNREEHQMKASAKDVIKALLMYRDDPVKRAKQKNSATH